MRRLRESRRSRLRRTPLTATALSTLRQDVPFYRRLPTPLRNRLHADISVFLAEKIFVGHAGFEIDERMRVVIAAHACVLQLNQMTKYYPDFTTIVLYPGTYVTTVTEHDGPLESTGLEARAGESWYRDPMVLSWADIMDDLRRPDAHGNVIFHEFAHKLDEQDGLIDGAPELRRSQLQSWPRIFAREYASMNARLERGQSSLMDAYGASKPAEFFAVAVEAFFVDATAMRERHPQLYGELRTYFELDPASWDETSADGVTGPPS